ncbi:hypothetical protein [Mycobacterium simiae]|uniref:hypothetical protein n=1 Tax=Mycobacterium simiae TaxID=1784 RepID=UPI001593B493|nr:hypothetical protein [Mycobacterium simiae]
MWWLLRTWWPVLLMTVTVCGHQDQDWRVGAGAADAEVVQAAAVAQGEFAELVDDVMVSWRMRKCPVGLCGGRAV